jgi:serine/threonine protein kinase
MQKAVEVNNPPILDQHISASGEMTVNVILKYEELKFEKNAGERVSLGQGSYGAVYLGYYHRSRVAIKELRNSLNKEILKELTTEVLIMKKISSPRIVVCYGMSISPCCLVMEYMAGGSLYGFIHGHNEIFWSRLYEIFLDVIVGMKCLHDVGIVHGDLKAANILLDENHDRAKIADFGGSRVRILTPEGEDTINQYGQKAGGTANSLAPELWNELCINVERNECAGFEADAKTTTASDIYSLGVLLWEMTTRKIPFHSFFVGDDKIPLIAFKELMLNKEMAHEQLLNNHNPDTPQQIRDMMQFCLFKDPKQRCDITMIKDAAERQPLAKEIAMKTIPVNQQSH